jgi:hypothetical protein
VEAFEKEKDLLFMLASSDVLFWQEAIEFR